MKMHVFQNFIDSAYIVYAYSILRTIYVIILHITLSRHMSRHMMCNLNIFRCPCMNFCVRYLKFVIFTLHYNLYITLSRHYICSSLLNVAVWSICQANHRLNVQTKLLQEHAKLVQMMNETYDIFRDGGPEVSIRSYLPHNHSSINAIKGDFEYSVDKTTNTYLECILNRINRVYLLTQDLLTNVHLLRYCQWHELKYGVIKLYRSSCALCIIILLLVKISSWCEAEQSSISY